eukprot:gene13998-15456_t
MALVEDEDDGDESNTQRDYLPYSYFYIGNIPIKYHSADLRSYFSQYIEKGAFKCFHFKHRPETGKIRTSTSSELDRICAIAQVYDKNISEIVKKCKESPWYNRDGNLSEEGTLPNVHQMTVNIQQVENGDNQVLYESKKEKHKRDLTDISKLIYEDDILSLPELKPPPGLPNGNVGTSMHVLLESIRNCKLPSSIIKSLGLQFTKGYSKRVYGSMPYCYGTGVAVGSCNKDVEDRDGPQERDSRGSLNAKVKGDGLDDSVEEQIQNEEDDAEEWERHESLNEDRSRSKERLYEEDIELKWEKGGSGLVFYTDSYYWHEMKGKDFDEDTTDDWDVDMSSYYQQNAGDRAAHELCDIRESRAIRQGLTVPKVAKRPKKSSSRSFGRNVLEKQGWTKGTGLGAKRTGIIEPIEADGQSSKDKRGFGYFGEKLNRHVRKSNKRPKMAVSIKTSYDEDDEDDEAERDDETARALALSGIVHNYKLPMKMFSSSTQSKPP